MMQIAKPMPGERGGQTQQPTWVQPSLWPLERGCGDLHGPAHQHCMAPSPQRWPGAVGALTFKDGADALPDGDGARPVELPQGQLHVEEGHPSKNSHQCVWDEKGSCGARSRAAVTTTALRRPANTGRLRVGGCHCRPSQSCRDVSQRSMDEGFGRVFVRCFANYLFRGAHGCQDLGWCASFPGCCVSPHCHPSLHWGGIIWLGWYKEQYKPSGCRGQGTKHLPGLEEFWRKSC